MESGFKGRAGEKRQRRPVPVTGRVPARPKEPADRRQEPPPSLWSVLGDAVHGLFFLALIAAALIHFGQVFDLVAVVVGVLSALSLRDAWAGWQRRLGH